MKKQNINHRIFEYIRQTFDHSQPFFLKDLYVHFGDEKPGTIRQTLRRLCDDQKITRVINGVYLFPNPQRLLKTPFVKIDDVIDQKYLLNKGNGIIGYRSGINFSNQLGLTSQTASVEVIYSNAVSNKKRNVYLNNNGIIVNAPRVEVNSDNYKLLQVLDLLTKFNQYSEYELHEAISKIEAYLVDVPLSRSEVDYIVSKYPLIAQVKFYKAGIANVFTHGQKGI